MVRLALNQKINSFSKLTQAYDSGKIIVSTYISNITFDTHSRDVENLVLGSLSSCWEEY